MLFLSGSKVYFSKGHSAKKDKWERRQADGQSQTTAAWGVLDPWPCGVAHPREIGSGGGWFSVGSSKTRLTWRDEVHRGAKECLVGSVLGRGHKTDTDISLPGSGLWPTGQALGHGSQAWTDCSRSPPSPLGLEQNGSQAWTAIPAVRLPH